MQNFPTGNEQSPFDEDSLELTYSGLLARQMKMEEFEGDILLWRELKEIRNVLADISTHLSKIANKE